MLLTLKSDFSDYYDAFFDPAEKTPHLTFNRLSKRVPRDESLRYLSEHSETLLYPQVVKHGKAQEFDASDMVVMYTDMYATNGTGIERIKAARAYGYASLFLEGEVTKHLVIGKRNYLFSISSDSWKSNVGDSRTVLLDSWETYYHQHFPLYSVTYVDKVAIHLNTAPKLIAKLEPSEVVPILKGWFDEHHK